ncbi:hypothetical protein M409DRAFT_58235 [Zasmidium cellare ATCC 36951]|uniref:Isochorismatase-like domain-containing protein n=1 Tax=Zasmidium cellare ATCC 36951 TaxID=1080233 RepID=A0A6A6C5U0_ZASCE|nr:uncharacterized protein M409DRAFT_58235 [Zasmidium cellare ATCC 36951]KAF2162474.1 hypothetical protein M409DRAFT_58235 [Zasmidium cellare ATCC 36951]
MSAPTGLFNRKDKSSPAYYGPSQTALLLLDFHSFLVEKALPEDAGQAVVEIAVKLRDWAKSKGILVIHGLVDAKGTPFATCKDQVVFANVQKMMSETDGGDEPAALTEGVDEDEPTFFRLPGYVSALRSPGLPQFLMTKGITSLMICGISTSGCVLRTSMAATDLEFVVTVIEDACADPHQEVHDMLVKKVMPNRGYVANAAEFMEGFERARG